jgi:hypothetical protein
LLFSTVLLAGCDRDNDIRVYRVAKETQSAQAAAPGQTPMTMQAQAQLPPGHPDTSQAAAPAPKVSWKLPTGWEQVPPGPMRSASFLAKASGKQADVGIFPPGIVGTDLGNVNRWRGQVGLGQLTEAELPKFAEPISIDGQTGQLYDQAGTNAASGDATRILAAILKVSGEPWFFKMTGEAEFVAQQKPLFVEFLKSLKFESGSAPAQATAAQSPAPSAAPGAAASDSSKPAWQVPKGWQETSGGQFLVAKFLVADGGSVNVSSSAGDGGGVAGNVNRWRGQLGLPQASEAEVTKLASPVDTSAGKAMLVDMAGTDPRTQQKARLVAMIVPRAGQTWFYKLMGPEGLVEREKPAFTNFVQSARYP